MAHAANWFYSNVAPTLLEEAAKRPDYEVFVAGHSLGAGTAALLCMLLQAQAPGVRAVCFAPPACVTEALCARFNSCITSVVLHRDLIPRFSTAALRELLDRVAGTDWKRIVREEFTRDVSALRKRVLEDEGVVKVCASPTPTPPPFRRCTDVTDAPSLLATLRAQLAAAARGAADVAMGALLAARDTDSSVHDAARAARDGVVVAAQVTAGAYLAARDSETGRAVADGVSRAAASTAEGARASLEGAAAAWRAAKQYPSVNEAVEATAAAASKVSEHPTVQAASRAALKVCLRMPACARVLMRPSYPRHVVITRGISCAQTAKQAASVAVRVCCHHPPWGEGEGGGSACWSPCCLRSVCLLSRRAPAGGSCSGWARSGLRARQTATLLPLTLRRRRHQLQQPRQVHPVEVHRPCLHGVALPLRLLVAHPVTTDPLRRRQLRPRRPVPVVAAEGALELMVGSRRKAVTVAVAVVVAQTHAVGAQAVPGPRWCLPEPSPTYNAPQTRYSRRLPATATSPPL